MKIKALKAFVVRDSSTGKQTSVGHGEVADLDQTLANQLITDGLAESYLDPAPTGSKSISENGTVDVADYASAVVNVGLYTITYNANGGTGSVAAEKVVAGNEVELSDGTGLTPPENKVFLGWAKSSSAQSATVTSPYKPTADTTLYAIYKTEEVVETQE